MELVKSHTLSQLKQYHPEAAVELENLQTTLAAQGLDMGLLKLCAEYFDAALGNKSWFQPDSLNGLEKACLGVCEQFMVSVAHVTDSQMTALSQHLTPDELYNLMYGIYLIEAAKRLELVLERTLQ